MRRLLKEWKTLGSAGFARARGRKASNRIRARYHRLAGTAVIRSRYNVLMKANWPDNTFRFCIDATYGFDLYDILNSHSQPFTFLDIGANQGVYSLIAGNNPHCQHVYSFEPMPATFDYLCANIEANNLLEKVTPINAGISNQTGTAVLSVDPTHTGGATLHGIESPKKQNNVQVELIDHSDINSRISPATDLIVKVDVEGHEETVFDELSKCTFASQIQLVHYEVDEHWVKPETLQSRLEKLGFNDFKRFNTHRKHHYDIVARKL